MKKLLLSVAILLSGIASVYATADQAIYSTTSNGYLLKSLWFQSYNQGNLSPSMCTVENNARSMAVTNGKVLICRRDGSAEPYALSIDIFDAATGNFIENKALASNVFKKDDGIQVPYGCNDIRVDDAGHVLLCNLVADNKVTPLQIWNVNVADGTGTKVLEFLKGGTTGTFRFETFDVYGDITGNGYIITANGGSNTVLRWEITNGVVASTPTELTISFYPTTATTLGNESRIHAIDSQKFYLDGQKTYPTLYSYDNTLTSISMVSSFADDATNKPVNTNRDGVDQFTINGKKFVSYCNTDPSSSGVPMNFKLVELGADMSFLGSTNYYDYPGGDGLYKTISYRWLQTVYSVVDNAGKIASLYLYGPKNGLAAYQFGLETDLNAISTGTSTTSADQVKIITTASGVKLSESAKVEVFNLHGQRVAVKENTDNVSLAAGVYIVKAINNQKNVAIEKVIVK